MKLNFFLKKKIFHFQSSLNAIKRIYCPCNIHFCPHANAVLNFRIKVGNFYAIKLPRQIYSDLLSQNELVKLYAYLIDEARALPILRDFRLNRASNHLLRSGKLASELVYAYCSKSLLPIDFAIVEEQARAKKWISDLFARRNSITQPTATSFAQPQPPQQPQPLQQQQQQVITTSSYNNGVTSNQVVAPNPIGNINMTLNNPLTNAPMHTFFHSSLSVPNFATSSK